jgi:hypothetical protein
LVRKARAGVQIRFNPETETDVSELFSRLKKAEVHVTAVCAFRMYMRAVGFYDLRTMGRLSYQMKNIDKKRRNFHSKIRVNKKEAGIYDKEALTHLNGLFAEENAPHK